MKKLSQLLLIIVLSLATFSSPIIAASSAGSNHDYNIRLRGYDPTTGTRGLIHFAHPLDAAPQLCGLVEGVARPNVTSLYQIRNYNGTGPELIPRDAPIGDYASLVGFETSGQNILVPSYAQQIGGGKQVTVLYADTNQILIKYTTQDNITGGYAIHILGLDVNPNLLTLYQNLDDAGRTALPALAASQILGKANGGEILVSVRDSGSFMDPRWIEDWWQCSSPASANNSGYDQTPTSSIDPNQPKITCNPALSGDRTSRPGFGLTCDACNYTTKTTGACATSFTVNDTVSWQKRDGETAICDSKHIVETNWGGTISIDPSNITIPFVGLKGHENGQWRGVPGIGGSVGTEGENTHLADYFDGTNEYYQNYRKYWLDYTNYAGVLRKLTPMAYQDILKQSMVNRAVASIATPTNYEGKIHDYRVTYPTRVCWEVPFIFQVIEGVLNNQISAILSLLNVTRLPSLANYCLYANSMAEVLGVGIPSLEVPLVLPVYAAIVGYNQTLLGKFLSIKVQLLGDPKAAPVFVILPSAQDLLDFAKRQKKLTDFVGHFPVKITDQASSGTWNTWKDTYWGQFWEAVPMTTREDTEGKIIPYLGSKIGDTFTITDPDKNTIEKVPHLARLYESSQIVGKILSPYPESMKLSENTNNSQEVISSKKSTTLLASAEKSLVPQVQAAVPSYSYHMGVSANYSQPNVDVSVSFYSDGDPGCDGDIILNINGQFKAKNGWNKSVNNPFTYPPSQYTGSPVIVNPGGSATVMYEGYIISTNGNESCVHFPHQVIVCTYTVSDTGEFSTNCGITPPDPQPVSCTGKNAYPVSSCDYPEAITSQYEGDKLCCNVIPITLTAKDKFVNDQYKPCETLSNEKCCSWGLDPGEVGTGHIICTPLTGCTTGAGGSCTDGVLKSAGYTSVDPNGLRCEGTRIIDYDCYTWVGKGTGDQSGTWACQGQDLNTGATISRITDPCLDTAHHGNGSNLNCTTETFSYDQTLRIAPEPICVQKATGSTGGNDFEVVSREIGISLYHPYLSKIWDQTANVEQGVFNNFRPAYFAKFPETPAYSNVPITYSYNDTSDRCRNPHNNSSECTNPARNNPNPTTTSGKFYFPYLGGIEQAKQWMVNAMMVGTGKSGPAIHVSHP